MFTVASSILWVGMDVHKDSITVAVFRGREPEPLRVDRIDDDDRKLRRYFERLGRDGQPRACYEASGAGYVLQRALAEWGIPCELAAPSLIPRRPGEHRKTDRRDAIKIARDFRDDRLVLIHIPTEAEERVRDLVRCRETFQREILKSRHYILKFLRRRGFIYREGTHWTVRHMRWIRQVLAPGTLAADDRTVLAESFALLEYKLTRRDELDRRIEELALTPRYKPVVERVRCFRGLKTQSAMVLATEIGDVRRLEVEALEESVEPIGRHLGSVSLNEVNDGLGPSDGGGRPDDSQPSRRSLSRCATSAWLTPHARRRAQRAALTAFADSSNSLLGSGAPSSRKRTRERSRYGPQRVARS